ncbi:MAG: hypothetical protein JNJ58_02745 [Chitinophagaceae bacterium]|nr:hypothetical protein [Chitinophagaceae bacterium]
MRILILIGLLLLSFNSPAQQKTEKTPEMKARTKTTEMVQSLKLSKEQETMLYSVNLKAYQSIATYEAKKPGKKMLKRQKGIVKNMREKEYAKVLSPAQYKQYQENQKKEKELKKKQEEAEKKAEAAKKSATKTKEVNKKKEKDEDEE